MSPKHTFIPGKILFVAAISWVFSPVVLGSDQETNARIEKLEAQLKAMQAELAKLKAERAAPPVDQKQIDQMVSKAIEEKKADIGTVPDWVRNMKLFGDLRYRYEWIDDESKSADQNRNRIRARLGLETKANDEVDLGFQLASGNAIEKDEGDPTSTNQTLGNAFSSKNIWIDLAYFDYHPAAVEGLNVYGGKIKNPYFTPGRIELLWDQDLNPEGLAVTLERKISDNLKGFGTIGGFYIVERSTDADSALWGFQGGLRYDLPERKNTYLTAGAGWFDFSNTTGENVFGLGAQGNSSTGGTTPKYLYDYDVAEAFAELGFSYNGLPIAVFGDYVKNTTVDDIGYAVGVNVGKCKEPGSWQVGYSWRKLEADATVGTFSDSDFAGGGTDCKGHEFSIDYQLAKNWQIGSTYFLNRRLDTNTDYDRLQFDLKYKF